MAEQAHAEPTPADHQHGEMPSQEQAHTYKDVMGLIHWGGLVIACLVLFLVLWFCTPTGFIPCAVLTVILGGAGTAYLLTHKPPPEAAH